MDECIRIFLIDLLVNVVLPRNPYSTLMSLLRQHHWRYAYMCVCTCARVCVTYGYLCMYVCVYTVYACTVAAQKTKFHCI